MSVEMEDGQKRLVTVKDESGDEAVGLQLEKCPNSLSVLSPDSAILVRNVENVKIETLSSEDSVLVEPSVLNETETITPSSDLESSPVSGDLLSESTVLRSAVGLLQQPVVLPCVLTHVQGATNILSGELPDQDPRGALLREDREDLAACVVVSSFCPLATAVKPWVIQSFLTFDPMDRTLKCDHSLERDRDR